MIGDFFRVTPRSRKVKLKSKKGVLFSNPSGFKRGLFYGGSVLFCGAIIYAFYLYWPIGSALARYWLVSAENSRPNGTSTEILTPTPVPKSMQNGEYTITIPKIMAFAKVVDGVSPFDQKAYLKVLENDVVAQAKDTANPGQGKGKMTYIFAHSTSDSLSMLRKNAVFYLLGELKNGDVFFINKDGKNYTYKVYKQEIINASQTEYLKYSDPEREVVILQTCWPIGTNWKRLLVFAEPWVK